MTGCWIFSGLRLWGCEPRLGVVSSHVDTSWPHWQGMSVLCGIKKYADRINTKYAEITELYILWSELNRRKLSPTLASAHYSCRDNAIGLVGRQLEAVGWKFSYYCQCLCRSNVMHNPHKLNIDSNRNTANIKMIKIAVEKANLCGKKYAICAPCWKMRQSHIRVKLTCLAGKLATAWR